MQVRFLRRAPSHRKAGTRSSPARSGQQFIPPPLCPAICPRVVLIKLTVPRRTHMITRLASNVSLIDNHILWRSMVPTASRAGGTRCLRTRCGGTCRQRQAHCTCGDAETNRQSELQLGITIEITGLTSREGMQICMSTETRGFKALSGFRAGDKKGRRYARHHP